MDAPFPAPPLAWCISCLLFASGSCWNNSSGTQAQPVGGLTCSGWKELGPLSLAACMGRGVSPPSLAQTGTFLLCHISFSSPLLSPPSEGLTVPMVPVAGFSWTQTFELSCLSQVLPSPQLILYFSIWEVLASPPPVLLCFQGS